MKVPYLKFIPLQKLVELELNSTQIILVSIIVSFAKDSKSLRAGRDNIAEAVPASASTVKRDLNDLVEKGLIKKISGEKQRNANEYIPTKKLLSIYRVKMDLSIGSKWSTIPPKGVCKEEESSFKNDSSSEVSTELVLAMQEAEKQFGL